MIQFQGWKIIRRFLCPIPPKKKSGREIAQIEICKSNNILEKLPNIAAGGSKKVRFAKLQLETFTFHRIYKSHDMQKTCRCKVSGHRGGNTGLKARTSTAIRLGTTRKTRFLGCTASVSGDATTSQLCFITVLRALLKFWASV